MEENALNASAAARLGRLRKKFLRYQSINYDAKRRIVEGKIEARL